MGNVTLMGDLNARFCAGMHNIPIRAGIPDCNHYTYPVIQDPGERFS